MEAYRNAASSYIESSTFFYIAGVITVGYITCKAIYNLYTHFIIYFTSSPLDFRKFGRWALITGSTDGIGKGIAREIAKMGIDVFLVSRNPEKLRKVAREIESEFHVEVKYAVFDFTVSGGDNENKSSVYDVIRDAIKYLEIGILVNNVGMFVEKPDRFLDSWKHKSPKDLMNCNMTSMVKMTQLVLPGMEARKKGLVINLSSFSGSFTGPCFSMYASSKRFVDTFSKALSYEYEKDGIIVQCIKPGLVKTQLAAIITKSRSNVFYPTYETFAYHMMRTVGKARVTSGYWNHAWQHWIMSLAPEAMAYINIDSTVRYFADQEEKDK